MYLCKNCIKIKQRKEIIKNIKSNSVVKSYSMKNSFKKYYKKK